LEVVKIGFKHLCEIMITEDVLVGGEESGGIAVKGHIPERDGVWNGLIIWEFMAKSGKSLRELIQEVYDVVGEFAFERNDLRIAQSLKEEIVANCQAGKYDHFGEYKVTRIDDMDGWKYWLSDHEWVMIRPSGTEPVLRTYAEAGTKEDALDILEACRLEIGA
jgi:phosphomannomutase